MRRLSGFIDSSAGHFLCSPRTLLIAHTLAVVAARSLGVIVAALGSVPDFGVKTTITNTGDAVLKTLDNPRTPWALSATNIFVDNDPQTNRRPSSLS